MKINITNRNFSLTQSDESYIHERIDSVLKTEKSLNVSSLNVVMEREKNRFITDVVMICKHHVFTTKVEDFDFFISVETALEKIHSQFEKFHEKLNNHHAKPLREVERMSELKNEEKETVEVYQ